MKQTVYLGADHAGFELKEHVREHLEYKGYIVDDLGAHTLDPEDDYPQFAEAVAEGVLNHPESKGILFCGNAQGICIAANKFDGIRAGTGFSKKAAETMRADDNANIICIPGRIKTLDDPILIAETFLTTEFSEKPRHKRRLSILKSFE